MSGNGFAPFARGLFRALLAILSRIPRLPVPQDVGEAPLDGARDDLAPADKERDGIVCQCRRERRMILPGVADQTVPDLTEARVPEDALVALLPRTVPERTLGIDRDERVEEGTVRKGCASARVAVPPSQ